MSQWLDRLEKVKGLPVLIGVALVLLNLVVRCVLYALTSGSGEVGFFLFLFTDGNLLLHLGIVVGLLGVLIGDIL
ncbi:MAG: hypothetical protein ACK2UA_07880 [Anaerolineae bacterium]|jgi:ABC-type tungstate transport system substrate-binding protein